MLGGEGTGSLADYKGKVVLVNVWASWCEPCRDELPLLERTHKRLAREGGTVLGIDVKENSGAALDGGARVRAHATRTCATRTARTCATSARRAIPRPTCSTATARSPPCGASPSRSEWLDATLPPLLEERA